MISFKLDPRLAKEAESNIRITEPGPYTGYITQAYIWVSEKGTQGFRIDFKSPEDGEIKGLTLWIKKENGDSINIGHAKLNALMTCLKIRETNGVDGIVKIYDFDSKSDVEDKGIIFPDFINKKIGFLFESNNYYNSNGELKESLAINTCFDAETRQTATEILENKPASKLEKRIESVIKKQADLESKKKFFGETVDYSSQNPLSEDIPF